jgi:hypothetical protein
MGVAYVIKINIVNNENNRRESMALGNTLLRRTRRRRIARKTQAC